MNESFALPIHLRVGQPALARGLRALMVAGTNCVVARLEIRPRADGCDWLIQEWFPQAALPHGRDWPGLADWVVLALASETAPSSEHLLKEVVPGGLQRVAALVLAADEGTSLTTTVWDRGQVGPPLSLEVVGSLGGRWQAVESVAQPEADSPSSGRPFPDVVDHADPSARSRSSRTDPALPVPLAELQRRHIAVVGVGRLGSLVAQGLAALVGRLTLIDPDQVGLENLDGMPLARRHDVGQAKVTAVAKRLVDNRSALVVTAIPEELRSLVCHRLFDERRFDLIVTCVDERGTSARLKATELARHHLVPHLDVGALIERDENGRRRLRGDVRLFEPGSPGCVACCPALPAEELRRAEVELAGPVGSLPPGPHLDWSTHRLGSLFHWNAVICGVAIETYLRFLAGEITSSIWTRLIWDSDRPVPSLHSQVFDAVSGCRRCRLPPAGASPGS